MKNNNDNVKIRRVVVVASFTKSLINFRGPLIRAFQEAGLEVHAAAPDMLSDETTRRELRAWGVRVHEIPLQRTGTNPMKDIVAMKALYLLFRQVRPEAVLAYTIKPVIYATLAAWLARVPWRFALITGLGYAFTGEAKGKRSVVLNLVRHLYARAISRTHRVFFQNPDDHALFHELGLLPERIPSQVVNGSGVDTAYFTVTTLPQDGPVFLLIARLLRDKGVREYVEAAALVRQRYPNILFRLVGDIDDNPDSISREELEEWLGARHVEYLGALSDVRQAITEASVYVLPSYREGTPRTVLEAMAMGRPIITTDAPGCRETVVEGENGFLVPVKSVDALAEAMQRFIEHPHLIARMGNRSREIAEEKYDVNKVNSIMLKAMGINVLGCQPIMQQE